MDCRLDVSCGLDWIWNWKMDQYVEWGTGYGVRAVATYTRSKST